MSLNELKKTFDYRIVEIEGKGYSAQASWAGENKFHAELNESGFRYYILGGVLRHDDLDLKFICKTKEEAQEAIYKCNARYDEWSLNFL